MKTRRKRSGGISHQSSDRLHDVCNLVHLRFGKSVHCGANSIKRIRFRGLCVCADIDQLAERNFKSVCDFSQRFNGGTFFPAFNFSDISGMDFGGKCQLLLAEVLFGAELTERLVLFFTMTTSLSALRACFGFWVPQIVKTRKE